MIVLDLSILNQKGTPMFNSDTFANRPAFGIVGRIFISTDTAAIYRDTGTAWDLIADGGSSSTNIYNSNGTLSANRVVSDGGFGLSFTPTTHIGTAAIGGGGNGKLIVGSSTADNGIQIFGANSPSLRIDNAQSGGTQRFVVGLATATNNFIQGAIASDFCITTASSGAILFGMWQSINASEVMRISTASNLIVGSTTDNGSKLQITGAATISTSVTAGSFIKSGGTSSQYLVADGSVTTLINPVQGTGTTNFLPKFTNTSTIGNSAITDNGSITTSLQDFYVSKSNASAFIASTNAGGYSFLKIQSSTISDLWFARESSTSSLFGLTASASIIYSEGAFPFILFVNGSTRLTIATTGNLLVGTTSDAGYKLDVNGTGRFIQGVIASVGSAVSSLEIRNESTDAPFIGFFRGGTLRNTFQLLTDNSFKLTDASLVANAGLTMGALSATTGTFTSNIEIGNSVSAAVAAPSTHKVSILIGGVQYYLLASNV